ncbi:hypothetical protein C3747_9g96 [Trypanosoma cruzi]|uniref:Xrn1 N-terminal domain-containing protein n=2 Tax=Trypanosoma cruzi TaxID=5693 RepID=Q4DQC3_TRYCC|nr:hypothetical protein, conserved [Trypanosoma cruzi]EAN94743.1 hypothetical protein, conserved [Trypanosoma cruzi]PWV19632.1 hypothetical protein C3747_9g96 [Trypanosoma cruzi]RNC48707.1 hypothetical protein TcCL_NonESM01367 [Trypanosoma cruzi]|eukprot:XP_816594.1 hypothetical protein [Trypanosoma cruzi strain CL Brener]
MGTQGLWNYLNKHGLCSAPPSVTGDTSIITPDHLLLDMNGIVHGAIEGPHFLSMQTIQDVLLSVKRLLRLFPPKKTLVLVFDGAAPTAKLKLQKERRATMRAPQNALKPPSSATQLKYNYDYEGTPIRLFREEVVSGSEFLLACEDALRKALMSSDGDDADRLPGTFLGEYAVIISGCEDAGEGELKISSMIRTLWIEQKRTETYTGDDVIVVVSNDSDLALIGIACTPYRQYYMVDPVDYCVTAIAELFEHWRKGAANGLLPLELLPSYRIDFVFLMLLSGGDWYQGVAGRSILLWRRYRELRLNGGYFRRSIIHGEDFNVDVEFLRSVMSVKDSIHQKVRQSKIKQATIRGDSSLSKQSVETGVDLLKGAMWALKSIVLGHCFDYEFRVSTICPTLGMLKAASFVKGVEKRIRPESKAPLPLLSPLEQCVAVMGMRGRYSEEILRALTTVCPDGGKKLTNSQSVPYLLSQVRLLMASVDRDKLTAAERELLKVQHADVLEKGGVLQDAVTFMSYAYSSPSCE